MKKIPHLMLLLLAVLAACSGDGSQMRAQLEELERQNRADSVMTNDSLAEHLVKYFDRHGTPNERMRAHYILGRTYADMGEAPRAIDAYLDAASQADTTAADCDNHTLSRIYGQMSDVFYQQSLLDDYLECLDKSIYYAWKANDTAQALNEYAHKIAAYDRINQPEMVVTMFDEFYNQSLDYFGKEITSKYCTLPIRSLLRTNNYAKADYYLSIYESKSGFFDSTGNIDKGREVFYYLKGDYYLNICRFDSADFFFRKELENGLDVVNQNLASHGLSLLYMLTNKPDSAAKYAIYGYDMNDSVYAQMATKEVEQAKALYDYSHHQREAEKQRIRAQQERAKNHTLLAIISVVVVSLVVLLLIWQRNKKHKERLFQQKLAELKQARTELDALHVQQDGIKAILRHEAELIQQVNSQEEEIGQRREEVAKMHKIEERLLGLISVKESLITSLQQELQCKNGRRLSKDTLEAQLEQTEVYLILRSHSKNLTCPTDREWDDIESMLETILPSFYHFISNHRDQIGSNGVRICILLRFNFRGKDIANLMEVSPAYISSRCRELLFKLFHQSGSGKLLAEMIKNLH